MLSLLAFAYQYFKTHARQKLTPKAFGRLSQDLSTRNIKAFTRSYKAATEVINAAIKMRYIVSTLNNEERISSLLARLEKNRISIKKDMSPPDSMNDLLSQCRFGVIFIPFIDYDDISQITLHYGFPNPTFLHLLRDTAAAWGYTSIYPAFEKNVLNTVKLQLTDSLPEQQEMITLGKTKTLSSHPQLVK